MHLGRKITCSNGRPTGEFISVGYAKGKFVTGTYYDEIIVETYYKHPVSGKIICRDFGTGIFHRDPTALLFNVYWEEGQDDEDPSLKYSGWKVQVWVGRWKTLAFVPTGWKVVPSPEYGQEIAAVRGDLENIHAPLNIGHKAQIAGPDDDIGPWHDAYLSSSLKGLSKTREDHSPSSITDLYGGDFTSIASCTPNRHNLCD